MAEVGRSFRYPPDSTSSFLCGAYSECILTNSTRATPHPEMNNLKKAPRLATLHAQLVLPANQISVSVQICFLAKSNLLYRIDTLICACALVWHSLCYYVSLYVSLVYKRVLPSSGSFNLFLSLPL
jgi:hypothetical protein